MKLKRLLAGFIAVAMTVTMIPTLVFADEAENGTKEPAAVEEPEAKEEEKKPAAKETKPAEEKKEPEKKEEPEEKPAESEDKKAEEPAEKEDKKEEPAETEAPTEPEEKQPAESKEAEPVEKAPEETKKPDTVTVTGKTTGESDSNAPKKAPITIGTIKDIGWPGFPEIAWNMYTGAEYYEVIIENVFWGTTRENRAKNPYDALNNAIKKGAFKRNATDEYTVTVYAYTKEDFLMAKGSAVLKFDSSKFTATAPSVGTIPGVKIKNGRLYYELDESETDYCDLYINNVFACSVPVYYDDEEDDGIDLKYEVDKLIKKGYISKPSDGKYTVKLDAYSVYTYKVYETWTGSFTYKSKATRIQTYTFDSVTQSNGNLKWSSIKGAAKYRYKVYESDADPDPYYGIEPGTTTSTSVDMNNYISKAIDRGMYDHGSYKVELRAINKSGYTIAMWTGTYNFDFEPNKLSVKGKTAKVKYSKLKKKKQTLAASKVINGVGTGRGPMTYTKTSGNKNISINKTTGKVTIKKKGLKRKTYKVTVKIIAAGNHGYYPSAEKTVTFKIKVK